MSVKDEDIDLKDKVVIITGANTGIGFQTALELARRGAIVTLACRDKDRADVACNKIKSQVNNQNVFVEQLDLADLDSVRNFAKTFLSKSKRLDILINNAGLVTSERRLTKNGFEMHFGVNHLGHFLLTNLLLDIIKKSAPSRIINVSSSGYKFAKMNWDDLQYEKAFEPFKAYSQSKLANILFTIQLAKLVEGNNVAVVALHPGVVKTDIFRDSKASCLGCIMSCFLVCIAKTPRDGAQTSVYCAVSKSIQKFSGQYFSDSKPETLVKKLTSEDDAEKLWRLSAEMVKL